MPPPIPSRVFARDALPDPSSQLVPSTATTTTLTQKLRDLATRTHLLPRLATDVSTVPEGYGRSPSGPDPGAVVGIVLGSIAGFIVLLWIIYWCVNLGNGPSTTLVEEGSVSGVGSSSVVSFRSRPRAHRNSHRHSRSSRGYSSPSRQRRTKETIEITRRERSAGPPVPPLHPEQIVVMEENSTVTSRSRSRSRSRAPPLPPSSSGRQDDEIIVLEEHTPPRRRDSRGYRRGSVERRSSAGYRDADAYRDMSRRRSSSRR
ncbi:hypothetical protein F4821DRAFT_200065 [Hypoxylon rubiginosum]|uniref:Uncharacterized protein n=1 Tax=Hypoxylon rubiginosum TaxID=110542 RepID=A0ACC0DF45_9PEZI|nr:hypothetical protein F4821DRAFT_200065 [Hypoxylon rubiginosum]